jgi:hypothetical protein
MKKAEIANALADKLTRALAGAFESVAAERAQAFHDTPAPDASAVPAIIKSYAYKNAGIAAACNVVPGPLGMVAAVPEIVLVTRNQLRMIYDVGVALGKGRQMNGRVLMAVLVTALGGGVLNLAVIEGGKLVIRQAPVRIVQRAVKWLGGEISKRMVRQLLAKWFPLIGAAAMAYWAKKSTEAIGKASAKLLAKY